MGRGGPGQGCLGGLLPLSNWSRAMMAPMAIGWTSMMLRIDLMKALLLLSVLEVSLMNGFGQHCYCW